MERIPPPGLAHRRRLTGPSGLGDRRIGRQMFPDALGRSIGLAQVIERRTGPSLRQTLTLTILLDYHQLPFGIDATVTIPIAAGGANFYFGGNNQFFHLGYRPGHRRHGTLTAGGFRAKGRAQDDGVTEETRGFIRRRLESHAKQEFR